MNRQGISTVTSPHTSRDSIMYQYDKDRTQSLSLMCPLVYLDFLGGRDFAFTSCSTCIQLNLLNITPGVKK